MTREQKLEDALREITSPRNPANNADYLIAIAEEALEPEWEPEVGKLYMLKDNASCSDIPYPYKWQESSELMPNDEIRLPTEQEWMDLGCPVIEVNKTMPIPDNVCQYETKSGKCTKHSYLTPQLTITEGEADHVREILDHTQHGGAFKDAIWSLLDGAKVELKEILPLRDNYAQIHVETAKQAMDAARSFYLSLHVSQVPSLSAVEKRLREVGLKIYEARIAKSRGEK